MNRVCVLVLLVVASWCCVAPAAAADAEWPTLLEHTALASGKFAPTPRTRLEKLQLATQAATQQPHLPAPQDRQTYLREDMRGAPSDAEGVQRENAGRAREPQAAAKMPAPMPKCGGRVPCSKPAPVPAPLPPAPRPDWGVPPGPDEILPTPPRPSCQEMNCGKGIDASDPVMVRVPHAPLDDAALGKAGMESPALDAVLAKIRNREGWLSAQKAWLVKASEAAATVRREIQQAAFTKMAAAADVEALQKAQDALSARYKAHKLKWAYKDRKMTVEKLDDELRRLGLAKGEIGHKLMDLKTEVKILESTLGPPSQQEFMSPAELADPLDFLKDIQPEDEFKV